MGLAFAADGENRTGCMGEHLVRGVSLNSCDDLSQGVYTADAENYQVSAALFRYGEDLGRRLAMFDDGPGPAPEFRFLLNKSFETVNGLGNGELARFDRFPRLGQRQGVK